ncbi:MAG TPA: peptidylprolyl isomerase [Pyrinomonadaceae bacterium]|nr:peptidylprolyl isomerase [Pyrinomonadaceae bacterium]
MKRAAFVPIAGVVLALTCAGFAYSQVPTAIQLRILQAEDERRWDKDLLELFSITNPAVRLRAALAAGRIGDEASVAPLVKLLKEDDNASVRAMAAFALGEVESITAADALVDVVKNGKKGELRARALEALGKIAGALPADQQNRQRQLGAVIREALEAESKQSSDRLTILLGLTAALRSKPADAGPTIAKFLTAPDSRIRSDAANALARLRLKDGNEQLRKLLTTDDDPNVRANAARVLGATQDKASFDAILERAMVDPDSRVRVSAIRALAGLKDPRAAEPLLKRAGAMTPRNFSPNAVEVNEALEIATTLGRVIPQSDNQQAIGWLRRMKLTVRTAPELEQALVRVAPGEYFTGLGGVSPQEGQRVMATEWRAAAAMAAGLGEIAALPDSVKNKAELSASAEAVLRAMLQYRTSKFIDGSHSSSGVDPRSQYAVPDVLRALAAFKPNDLRQVLFAQLKAVDVIVRATAAELLGDLPPSEDITRELIAAWPLTRNYSLNDDALSILDSLAKQKNATANEAIKKTLDSDDYLVRRRAAARLKENGAGDFSSRIGIVRSRHSEYTYRRALARMGKKVQAVVTTSKGSFTIELLPSEAPLTVDNFIELAQTNYFRGITIHRVVPNFVIQDGDPRGDGNGGPGYEIRCEINQVPYDRAILGMALSGKDTGGSQWFVTHAPQPHLDGGYTVFGRVSEGMNVVDRIVRGDVVKSVVIR